MTLTMAAAQRRFVGLTALRWLPNGLTVPVVVLLASARGLSVAEIGLVFIVHGVVVTLLELPTGGLADIVGRRPVLALSALLHLAGLLTLVVAQDALAFSAAFALVGVGRALDSGPLEAWYVDAAHHTEPGADVTPGLSRAGVANGLGLAAGAVVGGLLPSLVGGATSRALAVPLLLAGAFTVLYLIAVLVLVTPVAVPTEHGRAEQSLAARLRADLRSVPTLVRAAVTLARGDRTLRLLFGTAFAMGIVLYTLEVLGPLHFADLAGDRTRGSAVFGIVVALSFVAAAAGSALATSARRAARGSVRVATAVLFAVGAALLVGLALAGTVVLAALAYCAFYLTNGASHPLRKQLLHSRVDSTVRASTLSAWSLCLQLGGIAGGLVVPQLADRTGAPVAFAAVGGVLLVASALALRLPAHSGVGAPSSVPVAGR